MSFSVSVHAPQADRPALENAARLASINGIRVRVESPPRFKRLTPPFVSASIEDDSGFLAEDADWDDDGVWKMEPDARGLLARTLEILGAHGPQSWVFKASFGGDKPLRTQNVTLEELAALTRESKLGQRTEYVVHRQDEGVWPPPPRIPE